MASDKQVQANRQNAEKAGVKTEEGKNTIRHNSFKHGLTSTALISNLKSHKESQDEYLRIIEGLRESFKPRDFFEESLIEQMAKSQFKLKRFDSMEASHFAEHSNEEHSVSPYSETEHNKSKWYVYFSGTDQFSLLLKYNQSIEGQFYRALFALNQGRQPKQMDLFLQNPVEDTKNATQPD